MGVAQLLLDRGVGLEAGVWSAADAELLVASGLAARCLRVMVECLEPSLAQALDTLASCGRVIDAEGVTAPRLLHGLDATAWPLLRLALDRGHAVRIGLEVALTLPDGTPAPGNGALVAVARRLVEARRLRDTGPRSGRVVAAHSAASPDPLRLRPGQRVGVGRRHDQWPSYIWCTGPRGRTGWVAERFLARAGDDWLATADYSAAELSVEVGEQLTVTDEAGGWVWATTSPGAVGWLPAENVELSAP